MWSIVLNSLRSINTPNLTLGNKVRNLTGECIISKSQIQDMLCPLQIEFRNQLLSPLSLVCGRLFILLSVEFVSYVSMPDSLLGKGDFENRVVVPLGIGLIHFQFDFIRPRSFKCLV